MGECQEICVILETMGECLCGQCQQTCVIFETICFDDESRMIENETQIRSFKRFGLFFLMCEFQQTCAVQKRYESVGKTVSSSTICESQYHPVSSSKYLIS